MTATPFRVAIESGEIAGVLHLPADEPAACVVACHGMGASKDSDKYLLLATALPESGLALARFDFRGSGASTGRPADATIASRVADLEAVLDHLARRPELDGRFGLLGSSLGGFVALWVAVRRGPLLPVVTWNTPADLRELAAHGASAALVAEVTAGRYAEAPAGVPHVLVVQGGQDEVVPALHGRRLFERAAEPKAFEPIEAGDHRLTDPAHRGRALEQSRRWLITHLTPARSRSAA